MCRALNASANSNKNALVIMDNWGNGTLHGDKVALSTTALTTLGRNSKIFCFAATHNLDVINAVRNVQEISMHQIKVKLLLFELISKIKKYFQRCENDIHKLIPYDSEPIETPREDFISVEKEWDKKFVDRVKSARLSELPKEVKSINNSQDEKPKNLNLPNFQISRSNYALMNQLKEQLEILDLENPGITNEKLIIISAIKTLLSDTSETISNTFVENK